MKQTPKLSLLAIGAIMAMGLAACGGGSTPSSQSASDYFLMTEATDQWGTTGSNGADVTVTADFQKSTVSTYVGSTSDLSWTYAA